MNVCSIQYFFLYSSFHRLSEVFHTFRSLAVCFYLPDVVHSSAYNIKLNGKITFPLKKKHRSKVDVGFFFISFNSPVDLLALCVYINCSRFASRNVINSSGTCVVLKTNSFHTMIGLWARQNDWFLLIRISLVAFGFCHCCCSLFLFYPHHRRGLISITTMIYWMLWSKELLNSNWDEKSIYPYSNCHIGKRWFSNFTKTSTDSKQAHLRYAAPQQSKNFSCISIKYSRNGEHDKTSEWVSEANASFSWGSKNMMETIEQILHFIMNIGPKEIQCLHTCKTFKDLKL